MSSRPLPASSGLVDGAMALLASRRGRLALAAGLTLLVAAIVRMNPALPPPSAPASAPRAIETPAAPARPAEAAPAVSGGSYDY